MNNNKNIKSINLSLLFFWIVFTLHHIYGEYFVYNDGLHVEAVWISIPIFLTAFFLIYTYNHYNKKILLHLYKGLVIAIVAFLGIFEGFYNHIVLNVLTKTNVITITSKSFFLKAPSGDIINELSGAAEFAAAMILLYFAYKYFKHQKSNQNG